MSGLDWHEAMVFLTAGFYIVLLGGALFFGARLFLRASRREQANLDREQEELTTRAKQEVLADLEIARRAEAAATSQPGDAPSAPVQTERTQR